MFAHFHHLSIVLIFLYDSGDYKRVRINHTHSSLKLGLLQSEKFVPLEIIGIYSVGERQWGLARHL